MYALVENTATVLVLVYKCCYGRRRYASFRWLILDLLPVIQTSYKEVCKRLADSMPSGETMETTALYTSYPGFSFCFV